MRFTVLIDMVVPEKNHNTLLSLNRVPEIHEVTLSHGHRHENLLEITEVLLN